MKKSPVVWDEGVRSRLLAWWIGQLGLKAGEIRQTEICDRLEEREIPVRLLELTLSQQARRLYKRTIPSKGLRSHCNRISSQAKRAHTREDSQQ